MFKTQDETEKATILLQLIYSLCVKLWASKEIIKYQVMCDIKRKNGAERAERREEKVQTGMIIVIKRRQKEKPLTVLCLFF